MIKKEQFIEAILDSCAEIFEMMLPLTLTERMQQRPLPFTFEPENIYGEIIANLGLTGKYSGNISLYLPEQLALNMAGWLLQDAYTEINSDVLESVGEVINLIAGGLKNRLSSEEEDIFDMSIPLVISGRDKMLFHGSDKEYIPVPVETDKGLFFVTLVLDRNK